MSAAPSPRRLLLVAALCGLAFAASTLFSRALKAPDEIRVAEIGREMAVTGDWVTPRLDGDPFLEQPPLAYAAIGLAKRALGPSDAVARLPSCLAAIAAMLLAFGMARRLGGEEAGLLAVLVLASLTGFQRYATACMVDGLLMLAITLGQAAWLALLVPRDGTTRVHPGAVLLLHIAAGLAFLVKGVVGPALLYGPLLVDLVWHRRWALLRTGWHVAGVALILALIVAWPLALHVAEPELLRRFVEESVLGRMMPGTFPSGGHRNPPTHYLLSFPGMLIPWVLAAPALVLWLRRAPASDAARPATRAVAWLFPVGLLLLSIPGTRRTLYLLPLVPSIAVACAAWLASARRRTDLSRLESLTLLLLVAPFALLAELPARLVGALRGTRPDPFAVRPLLAAVRQATPPPAGAGDTPARLAWAMFGLFLAGNLLASQFQADDEEMTPMATDLAQLGAVGDALVGFRMDERTRAIVPLRTGQLFENVQEPAELEQRLAAHPGARLLVPGDQHDRLPAELLPRLAPTARWNFGRHEYVLYQPGEADS